MTSESAILRAYALLMQGRHEEAEATLRNAQGALDTPSGADLLARIRFEQGLEDDARRIWQRIHEVFPGFEPAAKAIDAFENPPVEKDIDGEPAGLPKKLWIAALAAVFIGVVASMVSFIKGCGSEGVIAQTHMEVVTNFVDRVETKFVERCTTNFIDRIQTEYRDRIITNVVDRMVEIPSSITITNTVENIVWITNIVSAAATNDADSPAITNIQDRAADDNQYTDVAKVQSSGRYVFGTPYMVKDGDTVSKLSTMYHFRIPDFKACNPEVDIDRIRVGQIVIFPGDIKFGDSP